MKRFISLIFVLIELFGLSITAYSQTSYSVGITVNDVWWISRENWGLNLTAVVYGDGIALPVNSNYYYTWHVFFSKEGYWEIGQSGYGTNGNWFTPETYPGYSISVYVVVTDTVNHSFSNIRFDYPDPFTFTTQRGEIVHFDSYDENNNNLTSYVTPYHWRWTIDDWRQYGGAHSVLTQNTDERLKATPTYIPDLIKKFHYWNTTQSNPLNYGTFHIDSLVNNETANYKSVAGDVSVTTSIDGCNGNYSDSVEIQDPWLTDTTDQNFYSPPYGFHNLGMAVPFKSEQLPLTITLSSKYKGVFLGQNPTFDPQLPVYSVGSPSIKTINNFQSYFQGWTKTGTSATFADSTKDTTAVVFNSTGATVTAKYKAHLGSSLPDATGGNGRKTVADQNGVQYVVYSSAGYIWFIHTDGSGGWTQEVKLGDGKNPSIAITSSNELRLVWEQDPGNGTRIVYYRRSTDGGATWQAAVTLATPTQSYDATPIALPASYIRALWRGTDGLYASIYYNIQGIDFIPSHLSLPSTAKSPSAAAMGDQVIELAYQDGNAIKYVELSYNTYYLSGNPVEVSIPNTTGNANPSVSSDYSSVYLAWEDTTNHRVYIRHSDDAGENWGSIKEITHGTDQLAKPSIGFDAVNGYTTLLFQCGSKVGESILIDFDTTWTPPIMLGEGMSPTIDANIGNISPSLPLRTVGSSAPYALNPMTLPQVWEFGSSTISSNTTWERVVRNPGVFQAGLLTK